MLAALTLPEVGELDAALLEVDRAVAPVGHDDVAALPGHLVVRVHARRWSRPARRAARPGASLALALPTVSVMTCVPFVGCRCPPVPRVTLRRSWSRGRRPGPLRAGSIGPAPARADCVRRRPAGRRRRPVVGSGRAARAISRSKSLERVERRGRRWRSAGRPPRPAPAAGRGSPARPRGWASRPQPRGPDRLLDPLGQQRERVLVDRPALAGLADAGDDLVPAERLGHAAALDHREDGLLDGGEPPAALRAGPPAADHLARRRPPASRRPASRRAGSTDSALFRSSPRPSCGRGWGCPVDRMWTTDPNLWTTYTSVSTRCSGRK